MRTRLRDGNVYAVSDRIVWRHESGAWQTLINAGTMLSSVFGTTSSNFWVLGDEYCVQIVRGAVIDQSEAFSEKSLRRYRYGWTDGDMAIVVCDKIGSDSDVIAIGE